MTLDELETIADRAAQDCAEGLPNSLLALLPATMEGSETVGYLINDIAQAIIETFKDRVIKPSDLKA